MNRPLWRKLVLLALAIALAPIVFYSFNSGKIAAERLTCEYMVNPSVVDSRAPRLSWINTSKENMQSQQAYQVQVASSLEKLNNGQYDLWDSGKVESNQSVLVEYNGRPLESMMDCFWRVRVWDNNNKESKWSDVASWHMGLLNDKDWKAQWIGVPWQQDESPEHRIETHISPPAPLLRKNFTSAKEIASARVYISGLGYYELYINGEKVGDDVLTPNQTNYSKREGLVNEGIPVEDNFKEYRVFYLSYDVKEMIINGDNAMGVILGNGFFNPTNSWPAMGFGTPRLKCQLQINYSDGSSEVITSDPSWKVSKSAIISDMLYKGEHYDARMEQQGWSEAGFDDSAWESAIIRSDPYGKLQAQMAHSDKVMERISPVSITKINDGRYRVDFGEEIAGWVRIKNVSASSGHVLEIKPINESVIMPNTYTFKGGEPESYAPRFVWYTFREVDLINWPGELTADQLVAEAVYTETETTGEFECSNDLFNNINKIWWRSQTDNMHGGLTSDCPHREKLGYTGDAQVACVTVMHNFDAAAFYTKWIGDIRGAQNVETGYVPNVAPWEPGGGGGVAWGAAINIMPWEFFVHYGDTMMLKKNYDAMKFQLEYMKNWITEEGVMESKGPLGKKPLYWVNLGDWCSPSTLVNDFLVHTFYLWRCADFTAKTAAVLGDMTDYKYYSAFASNVKEAFHKKYYSPKYKSYGPYGGNIFALKMGVPDSVKTDVVASLKRDIEGNGGFLDTGIFGSQFFFEVLSDNGLNELAYTAMNQREAPSFGAWIEQGATTTWEEWGGANSHNHPMFGGAIVWFYRKLAGMDTDENNAGYRHIIFRPQPAGDITYAKYYNRTPYGQAGIHWQKKDQEFIVNVTIPIGSTATVYVPTDKQIKTKDKGITFVEQKDGCGVYNILGSGIYKMIF